MDNLIDLHTHSVLSTHAFSSITENIKVANEKGLKYYGTSEHQYDNSNVGVHHYAIHNLRVIPKNVNGTHILKGTEFNILPGGAIDTVKIKREHIDYGIASIHSFCYKDEGFEKNTEAYLNALENEFITILGHIDDGRYPCDYDRIVKRTKELHKLIELNNTSLTPETTRINSRENMIEIINSCIKYEQPLIINSDAHICYDVGNYELAYNLLKELNFPDSLLLNTNENLIKEYFDVEKVKN